MTKNAMRRQLYNAYANPGDTFDRFINNFTIMYKLTDGFSNYKVLSQQEKIKQIRFLQGRGIDSSTIHQVLSGKFIENYENTN